MSERASHDDQRGAKTPNTGPEPVSQRRDLHGSVEPLDDHQSTDHFALLYEHRDEQFAAAIPFIDQGLERGERCLYVADENSRAEIVEAMRAYGIDVDAALDSGALSILTPADTYRRTGEFDRTSMLEYWEESLDGATDEDGYTGIRAAAEMTWALDGDESTDELIEYEADLNSLYRDEDYVVMCQYDMERFPAAVIHDVIKTHPHVVADGTVSQNFYYTPPEKFFGSEEMEAKVDRMMRTLEERTEVKTALKERQAYLEKVFESSHDAILIVDPQAEEIVDTNPAATEMLGYTHDELLTLGPSALHPDELDSYRAFVAEVIEDGTGWTSDLTCRTKNGGEIPVEISASRMDLNGRPVMLAVVRDMSERRRRERAQQNLYDIASDPDLTFDEKLQGVFELGCEHFDLDLGGIARVDPEADSFEVETISGEHEHLVPGEQYPLSETYCRLVTDEGETASVVDPVDRGFDGKLCYEQFGVQAYLGTYFEFEDGNGRSFFFLSNQPRDEDFSEADRTFLHLMGQWMKYELDRRHREQKLRERTEHLSALVETSPDCIKTVSADGTLLQMNPAGLEIGEADAESDVVGECIYDFIAPEHRKRYREFNERICRGERGSLEFDIIGLEGTRRHLQSHSAPLDRPDGTTVQVAVSRDITEQVERKQELEATVDQLQQSNDRLKQFAYAASHDLQEPLRMVSSYLQLLENNYRDDLDDEAREYIDFAVDGADRMRAMVDDLLAYSRVEQSDGEFESVECDVLLDQVSADLQVQIEETDAEIHSGSLPTVIADGEQLEQLFSNLVSNAIKYNDAEPPQVEIAAEEHSGRWEFSIADNGIGMDPEKTDRIFEVFKRLHHDDEYPGTGIGLSLCQEIVENHGGDIWVESEPGEGSTFYFTLPQRATE